MAVLFSGVLLLLSLLHSTQSAPITVSNEAESIAVTKMETLGKDALKHLVSSASSALRKHSGSHSVGCIREPKKHERLNCTLLSTFSSYLEKASGLSIDTVLRDNLKDIKHRVDDRKIARCNGTSTNGTSTNTCKEIFQENLENLRSVLELYIKWIVKPME